MQRTVAAMVHVANHPRALADLTVGTWSGCSALYRPPTPGAGR
jgi:hypothetical protein